MRVEEQTRIKKRFVQYAIGYELQHDEKASDTAVAVQKGVDGLELHVRERRFDQGRRRLWLVVDEALKRREAIAHLACGRRHKRRVARPRAANPDLRAAQLAWRLASSSRVIEQYPMDLADEPVRDRQARAQQLHAALQ